jgi:hypothetical protein
MKILPLKGKYYGTEIHVEHGPLAGMEFKLWKSTGNPSDRQLAQWGVTRVQWDNNDSIECGFGEMVKVRDAGLICDSHYESQETFELAQLICATAGVFGTGLIAPMSENGHILVSIQQQPSKGENTWSYAVLIGKAFHKLGFGSSYEAAARMAKSGVKSAMKYIESLKTSA